MFPDADVNEPVLIDFKTANKPIGGPSFTTTSCSVRLRQGSQLRLQKSGLIIRKAVIACAVPDYEVQIFQMGRDDLNQLYAHFLSAGRLAR